MSKPAASSRHHRLWPVAGIAGVAAIVLLAAAMAVPPVTVRGGEEVFASLGTGELSGIYYPVGQAICRIVNNNLDISRVRCSPETTPGSVYNIDAVRSGELEFALVQSDIQFAAYHGRGAWVGHPFRGLRSVLGLYPELLTIMVRTDSPIRDLSGLAGRRMDVGSRGSGTRATWDAIEAELGWRNGERVHPVELRAGAARAALCSGTIDANAMIVGHPSSVVRKQEAACGIRFVTVAGPAIDRLLRDHPYYQRGTISGDEAGHADQAATIGVRATLVTSASVDARVVAAITKELLAHVAEFRTLHSALAGLTTSGMMSRHGMSAPLHSGATQVYEDFKPLESSTL
jgi:uncharacterized protein